MYIIIVGGGKVGYYLAKTLAPWKHRLFIIEKDKDLCVKIVNELNNLGVSVINGDGTDVSYLDDAGADEADLLIAATGHDENNLVASQLAKAHFNVPKTIVRVNNPKNIHAFKQLGVDSIVCSTAHIADIIEREVEISEFNAKIPNGKVFIKDMAVEEKSSAVGLMISDLRIPQGTILISVVRHKEVIIPNGQTVIEAGDVVYALSKSDSEKELSRYFTDINEVRT